MPDSRSMREQIAYLRQQAVEFGKLAKLSEDETERDQFNGLADTCAQLASDIDRSLYIHQKEFLRSKRDLL